MDLVFTGYKYGFNEKMRTIETIIIVIIAIVVTVTFNDRHSPKTEKIQCEKGEKDK